MKPLLSFFICLSAFCNQAVAQVADRLTLSDCYTLARHNYPLVKERDLIARTADYTIENIQTGNWPQLTVSGQASYQSAVTEIPVKMPGFEIPSLSKDQYKLYGEVTQTVYDGGAVKWQKQVQKSIEETQQRELESTLYQLHNRINQLFFGVLLIDEELKQNALFDADIQSGLNRIQAMVDNGTALKSNADVLKADLLKNRQHTIELHAARKTYTAMLGVFTGKDITDQTMLAKPPPGNVSPQISRPELLLYDARNKSLDARQQLLSAKLQPRLALFLQGGAGRPALNFLSNHFEAYYIAGLRLIWTPSAWYTIKKEKAIIGLNKKDIDLQKETFLFNTGLEMSQQRSDMAKYSDLLSSDDEIIELRNHVKTASLAQLENGVISSSDYLREVNAEDQARQNKILHEIQLLTAGYMLQTITGNQQ
ncbi:MAG: TolC family protein [Chitinophagaceae bacterium]|nr:TolC family protein [Chitinophagaceae bacterium]